ncbi:hypothetical protein O6P43_029575 [Quillaja saponaria]|uniref:Uncharacterized protein n=1 Tax=Quillaja saponaria TaxID=32244 RepID=A0AAD7L098_QUISA|nr:hypothetical protein O6P43_029575 [Quillaja saponaria]
MDNMEARFIGLDSSLQDYKTSVDLSFHKLKLDMDSKFQTLMEVIASLRASRMEVYTESDMKLQATHESFILPTTEERNQDSTLPNLSTSLNEGGDEILKQKEYVLSYFTGNHQNSPMIPQPPTLMAEVDEIKIVAPPRTPRKEAILQEIQSSEEFDHDKQEIEFKNMGK